MLIIDNFFFELPKNDPENHVFIRIMKWLRLPAYEADDKRMQAKCILPLECTKAF